MHVACTTSILLANLGGPALAAPSAATLACSAVLPGNDRQEQSAVQRPFPVVRMEELLSQQECR